MKYLLAFFAALVVGFGVGWILYTIIFGGYFISELTPGAEGFYRGKGAMFIPFILSQMVIAIFVVWLVHITRSTSALEGARVSATAIFLVVLSFNFGLFASTVKYASVIPYLVDTLANAVMAAAMGGMAGWILKRFESQV
jgi:hypothetical protein